MMFFQCACLGQRQRSSLRVKHGMPLPGKPGPGAPGKITMGLKHAKGQGAFAALLRACGAVGGDGRCLPFAGAPARPILPGS